MTPYILILVGLHIGVPVRCYEDAQDWKQEKAIVQTVQGAVAFYNSDDNGKYIALGPWACKSVRTPTLGGAWVLGHEITHMWQDRNGTPFDEDEADSNGRRYSLVWLKRLEKFFDRKAAPLVTLEP